jgi:hypothetical protein
MVLPNIGRLSFMFASNARREGIPILDWSIAQEVTMLPLPCEPSSPNTFPDAPEMRTDSATTLFIDEVLAIQREAGGELGYFAAYRRLAALGFNHGFACDLLERGAWRVRRAY